MLQSIYDATNIRQSSLKPLPEIEDTRAKAPARKKSWARWGRRNNHEGAVAESEEKTTENKAKGHIPNIYV